MADRRQRQRRALTRRGRPGWWESRRVAVDLVRVVGVVTAGLGIGTVAAGAEEGYRRGGRYGGGGGGSEDGEPASGDQLCGGTVAACYFYVHTCMLYLI